MKIANNITPAGRRHTTDAFAPAGEFTDLVAAINRLPGRVRDLITLKYGANLNNR
jgi:hypothetical protein